MEKGQEQAVRPEELLRALWEIGADAETEKAADRIKALELCGKMLGVFERGVDGEEKEPSAAALTTGEKEALLRGAAAAFRREVEQA